MGFLELLVMMIAPYFVICRIGRRYSSLLMLVLFVVVGVTATCAAGILYAYQLFDAGLIRDQSLKTAIGMGFWFSLFGSVVGAFHGRKWANKDAAKAQQLSN